MASYSKGLATKRKFVMSAFKHLESHDERTLTVRMLAAENGYSVAALYKHFESLDYLLDVASVHFLNNYLNSYADLLDGSKSPLQVYMDGWKLFIDCAFEHPDIFYRIFWRTDRETLEFAFTDYFRIFPSASPEMNSVQFGILMSNGDMRERDLALLAPLLNTNIITSADAEFLCTTNELIVSGLLWRAVRSDQSDRESLRDLCHKLIIENVSRRVRDYDAK